MSKNKINYVETTLIKSKTPRKFRSKFFLVLLGFILLLILLINITGKLFNINDFSLSAIFNNTKVAFGDKTYYAVNMDKAQNEKAAQNLAGLLSLQGASGYIWQNGNEYEVVGGVYNTKSDAESVLKNIQVTNPNAYIKEIKINKVKVDYNNYTKEQRKVVVKAVDLLNTIKSSVYKYSIQIDTKEITPTTASSFVNNLKSDALIMSLALDVLNSATLYEQTILLKNLYLKNIEILNELVLKLISGENVNQIIKYSYVDLLRLEYDFVNYALK